MTTPAKLDVKLRPEDIERFKEKVDRSGGPDACWPWKAARFSDGYGAFQVARQARKAHRVAFFVEHGRWPTDCILHRCDNPPCVNPRHLFEGSLADNVADKLAKGRQATGAMTRPETRAKGDRNGSRSHPERLVRGSEQWCSKLTEVQVAEIRARHAAGETTVALAKTFGVSQPNLSAIVLRKTWRHVA